ncbi:hypothetical protein JXQ31_03475 [candidate division KSB1 bacterium]|nr:hypothetical protein [candidate division KSB1 bacterium]
MPVKSLFILTLILCIPLLLFGQIKTNTSTPEPENNFIIFLQSGGNYLDEFSPSVNAGAILKINKSFWAQIFYERQLGSFNGTYPAVWETEFVYPEYGRLDYTTGPSYADYHFNQNVLGVDLFYMKVHPNKKPAFFIGGGFGLYTGSVTRPVILTAPENVIPFKNSYGFNILSGVKFPITKKYGILASVRYHIVKRSLDQEKSNSVRFEYNSLGGVISATSGDIVTYYINEYNENGQRIKVTEIRDVSDLSDNFNDLSIQLGIYINLNLSNDSEASPLY